ncbi:hypothetical protein AB6A40_003208 [Gnathostoma spinigerum]|uniref:Ubiquitin-conjugating enzyme E2 J1 n=1 Tax=Gnathostoma spinigerum TaxID=75299 RepID=A0ABD6E8W7_9BILA
MCRSSANRILQPNGRFQLNQKICLSISGHHPESWQPSWSIRTALLALIGFMPTHSAGALGSLEYPSSERKKLAIESREWKCDRCGVFMRDVLTTSPSVDLNAVEEARELAKQISFKNLPDAKNTGTNEPVSNFSEASVGNSSPATESVDNVDRISPVSLDSSTEVASSVNDESSVRQRISSHTSLAQPIAHSEPFSDLPDHFPEQVSVSGRFPWQIMCILILSVIFAVLAFRRLSSLSTFSI